MVIKGLPARADNNKLEGFHLNVSHFFQHTTVIFNYPVKKL